MTYNKQINFTARVSLVLVSLVLMPLPSVLSSSSSNRRLRHGDGSRRGSIRNHRKLIRAGGKARVIDDRYIVRLRDDQVDPLSDAKEILGDCSNRVNAVFETAIKGFSISNLTHDDLWRVLNSDKVLYAEEDQEVSVSMQQGEAPWGLDRIDQRDLPLDSSYRYYYPTDSSSPSAGGSQVLVYVVDSGLDYRHPEFGGRASCGKDLDEYGDGFCGDSDGHGTHVAATVAGATFGVAKNVNVIGVKVLGDNGRGPMSTIVAGVDWVESQRSKSSTHGKAIVLNLSIEASVSSSLNDAVNNAYDSGILVVAAAGNAGDRACESSPASAERAFTVGSTNKDDERAWFSNYGSCVDIFAPGQSILSANPGGGERTRTGTSMSAPLVSGTAALYLQNDLTMSPQELIEAILRDATPDILDDVRDGSPNLLLNTESVSRTAQAAAAASSADITITNLNEDSLWTLSLTTDHDNETIEMTKESTMEATTAISTIMESPPGRFAMVTGLLLVRGDGVPLGSLSTGDTVSLSGLPAGLNVQALTAPYTVGSVQFWHEHDGDRRWTVATNNALPYTLTGDVKGNSFPLLIGNHKVRVTPYSLEYASGDVGYTKTVSFTVVP